MEWQDIKTHGGRYEVSRDGRVRNNGKILRGWISTKGYAKVSICGSSLSIHRLVALAFIPNPKGFGEINHIDGDKLNNDASNLEWCSRSHNMKHAYAAGLHPGVILKGTDSPNYGRNGARHCQSVPVRAMFLDGSFKDYESQSLAERDGFSGPKISECIRGKRLHHGGAKWMPLPDPPKPTREKE